MRSLLQAGDAAAVASCRQEQALFQAVFGDEVQQLGQAISRFSFEEPPVAGWKNKPSQPWRRWPKSKTSSRRMRRRQWRGGAGAQALNAMAAWLDAPAAQFAASPVEQAQVRQSLLRFFANASLISDQQLVQARQENA